MIGRLVNRKSRMVMQAGKEAAAGEDVETRRRVAARDVDAATGLAGFVPFHGDAVGGVLRRNAKGRRQPARADGGEADEADAGHTVAVDELGAERRGSSGRRHAGSTR